MLDDVPLDQDFFSIGGNSLSAIMLHVRIRETYGFEFPVEVLFDADDLEQVATHIEQEIARNAQSAADAAEDRG